MGLIKPEDNVPQARSMDTTRLEEQLRRNGEQQSLDQDMIAASVGALENQTSGEDRMKNATSSQRFRDISTLMIDILK